MNDSVGFSREKRLGELSFLSLRLHAQGYYKQFQALMQGQSANILLRQRSVLPTLDSDTRHACGRVVRHARLTIRCVLRDINGHIHIIQAKHLQPLLGFTHEQRELLRGYLNSSSLAHSTPCLRKASIRPSIYSPLLFYSSETPRCHHRHEPGAFSSA